MRRSWLPFILGAPLLPCAAILMYAAGWIPSKGILVIILVVVGALEAITILTLALAGHPGRRAASLADSAPPLYADGLVTITTDRIIFHHYGFFTSRDVPLTDVHAVRALRPTVANGKWRLGGTGDFKTWFPNDFLRFRRDTIFVTEMKGAADYQIGFTVKDSGRVRTILRELGVLHPICSSCGYDLRASKERCPECGTAIPPAP